MSRLKVLILGGTTEATELARRLAGDDRFDAQLSLAGVTRAPRAAAVPTRIGGFGGAEGLRRYLTDNRIAALVDATHPFAAVMSGNAVTAAAAAGVPHLAIVRPPWQAGPDDRWRPVADMAAAAAALGSAPRRVFLTVGRKELAPFAAAPQHRYLIRSVDPPPSDLLPPDTEVIAARGPFAEGDELELIDRHAIEVLVTKNSGGSATAAKLAAARTRGIPVVMVERPPRPAADTVADADAALDWLVARHHDAASTRREV